MKKIELVSGYGIVQRDVMRMPGVSKEAKSLYALLASYLGNAEYCWPSMETQARDLQCSVATIKRLQRELEKANLLGKEKLYPDEFGKSHNKYRLYGVADSSPMSYLTDHERPITQLTHEPQKNNIRNKHETVETVSSDTGHALKFWSKLTGQPAQQAKSVQRNLQATINQYGLNRVKMAMQNLCSDGWTIDKQAFSINRLIKPDKRHANMTKFAAEREFTYKDMSEEERKKYFALPYGEKADYVEQVKKQRIANGEAWTN